MSKNKIIAYILTLCCMISTSSCVLLDGKDSSDSIDFLKEIDIPDYEKYASLNHLKHVAFLEPYPSEKNYQWLKECGMTDVLLGSDWQNNTKYNLKCLEFCEKYGLSAYLMTGRGMGVLKDEIEPYLSSKALAGLYTDEPLTESDINVIYNNQNNIFGENPKYDYMTTLIQNYAIESKFTSLEEYYEYYFKKMQGRCSSFAMDLYPLLGGQEYPLSGDVQTCIKSNWLYALQCAAMFSRQYDVDFVNYIATMSIASQRCRRPSLNDLMYTAMVSLAYGAKGIAYFCYNSPGVGGEFTEKDYALVTLPEEYKADGVTEDEYDKTERTETYYKVQKMIEDIDFFDHALLAFDWNGTLVSAGTQATTTAGQCFTYVRESFNERFVPMLQHERVKLVNNTEDLLIGTFQDGDGYDGFLLVNFADTYYERSNMVNIAFNNTRAAIVYDKSGYKVLELKGGTYTTSLGPGEGRFVIPLK